MEELVKESAPKVEATKTLKNSDSVHQTPRPMQAVLFGRQGWLRKSTIDATLARRLPGSV